MTASHCIRAPVETDRAGWFQLWEDYCRALGADLPLRVSESVWDRITAPADPVRALLAVGPGDEVIGFGNYVRHPHTWSEQQVCYLEDLFVAPRARRAGVGTALIRALKALGEQEGWFRIYWVTETGNHAARAAYDALAERTDHVRYQIALGYRAVC